MLSSFKTKLFALCLACLLSNQLYADTFETGTQQFKTGQYEAALSSFLKAQTKTTNKDNSQLLYSLGATYFRLKQYDAAKTAFKKLANSLDINMRTLSHYNLGLIANKQGDHSAAISWFMQVIDETDAPNIERLARTALARLQHADTEAPSSWFGLVSLDMGFDDNVTLQSDTVLLSASKKADFFVDAYAYANQRISGDQNQGLSIDSSLFVQKYQKMTQFDLASLNAGLNYATRYGSLWQTESSIHSDLSFLDGRAFTSTTSVYSRGRHPISHQGNINLSYELAHIDAMESLYSYLTGWRQRITLRPYWQWKRARLDLSYRQEWNDRKDRQGRLFSSFSALRQRILAKVRVDIFTRLSLTAELRYRHSRYRDPDEITRGVFQTRREDRSRLSLTLRQSFRNGREISAEYSYTDNDANVSRYAYTGSVYMIGLLLPW